MILHGVVDEKLRIHLFLENCKNSNARGNVKKFLSQVNLLSSRRLKSSLYDELLKFAVRFSLNLECQNFLRTFVVQS